MSLCTKCGKELPEDANFCLACGTQVRGEVEETERTLKVEFEEGKTKYDPKDVWLFTHSRAIKEFRREGKLEGLSQDIREEVMVRGRWRPEELEYLEEIDRLLEEDLIDEQKSRWASSPFPPTYRALRNGKLVIQGKEFPFRKGQEMVFQCQMAREMRRLEGPVLIGNFSQAKEDKLCGQMKAMMRPR